MTKSTKETIILVAGKLFAEKGYEGTSVRDISTEAGVNLASVNYHFKNKQGLFHQVMSFNMEKVELEIQDIADMSEGMQDFSVKLFEFFSVSSNLFINSYKLFIANNVPCDNFEIPEVCAKNNFGPPGFQIMMKLIDKEIEKDIPQESREWAIRTIFMNIVQTSLIATSAFGKILEEKVNHFSKKQKKQAIMLHTQAILNFLVQHPEKFNTDV